MKKKVANKRKYTFHSRPTAAQAAMIDKDVVMPEGVGFTLGRGHGGGWLGLCGVLKVTESFAMFYGRGASKAYSKQLPRLAARRFKGREFAVVSGTKSSRIWRVK